MDEARTGDIVGIVGLKETSTGHTLVRTKPIILEPIELVPTCHLHRCRAEEQRGSGEAHPGRSNGSPRKTRPSSSRRMKSSYQTVVSGMGELHLDVVMRRIKEEFGIDLLVGKPQVVYKETDRAHGFSRAACSRKSSTASLYRGSVTLSLAPNPRGQGISIIPRISEAGSRSSPTSRPSRRASTRPLKSARSRAFP